MGLAACQCEAKPLSGIAALLRLRVFPTARYYHRGAVPPSDDSPKQHVKSVTRPTVVVSNRNVVGSLRAKPDSMEVFQGIEAVLKTVLFPLNGRTRDSKIGYSSRLIFCRLCEGGCDQYGHALLQVQSNKGGHGGHGGIRDPVCYFFGLYELYRVKKL